MCIAAFLRNNFKLLCKQSFTYKTEMICSLVPSEEFELLELFACMASVQFSLCKITSWVPLVVQWWRDWLPVQGTWVRSLVQEYPTCCGVTKPVHHNYWSCAQSPCSATKKPPQGEVHTPQLERSLHLPQLEKSPSSDEDPAQPKISKQIN